MKYLYSLFEYFQDKYPPLVILLLHIQVLVFVTQVLWSGTGPTSVLNKSYHVVLTLIVTFSGLNTAVIFSRLPNKWSIHFCLLVITLRFPTLVIRGILSVAWCARDPDLLLSCGKDNRILCWNPNSPSQNDEVSFVEITNFCLFVDSVVILFTNDIHWELMTATKN